MSYLKINLQKMVTINKINKKILYEVGVGSPYILFSLNIPYTCVHHLIVS